MAKPIPFTATNESVTVVWKGESYVVKKGSPHFAALKKAIDEERWDDVPKNLTVAKSVQSWSNDKFKISGDDQITYLGERLPKDINDRIIQMTANGENPTPMYNFWERLQKNPSGRSVDQLWSFLKHKGIPLTDDGCFLAYKGVRNDYRDVHSGKFLNKPGAVMKIARNHVSDDPREACHEGFHVGALGYARSFGQVVVVCKVDPKDVVCVPYDSSQEKMRVCKYEVLGNHNGELLPSTAFKEDDATADQYEMYESNLDKEAEPLEKEKPIINRKTKGKGTATPPKERKAHKFDSLNTVFLMEKSLDELRNYATYGLMIVGASKIPGGKTALVSRIIKVREQILGKKK